MNPDYLRLNTRPKPETPPQGFVDLFHDATDGTLKMKDANGDLTDIGGASAESVQTALAEDPDTALAALGSTVNHQNFVAKKVSAWSSLGSPPVRILLFGDSFSTGLFPGPKMGIAGWIGLGRTSGSGTINDLTGRFDLWMTGAVTEMAAGAVSQFTVGGSATGDLRGDRACMAFIKEASGGSFDLEYQANATGSWIPMSVLKEWTVNTATDVITCSAHGFVLGQGVRLTNSGGALPTASGGNLAISTTYFVIPVDANTFKLARTQANALASTSIDITGAGTGTHTVADYALAAFTVDAGTDVFTAANHGFVQNQGVRLTNSGGALPTASGGNLAIETTYYVIYLNANTFKLARTAALATAGTGIDITGTGTGTHTATAYASVGISAANASTVGDYKIFALPTSNAPFFRLRVTGVNGTSIKIIAPGIYNTNGGGVIWMPVASQQGTTFAQNVQTPSAVLTPIWGGFAPDMVLAADLDFPYEWEPGGNARAIYTTLNGIKSDTDWVRVGNHNVDESHPENASVDVPASNLAMRNWAIAENQTYVDVASVIGTYAQANAAGLMGDNKHLNVAGRQARNNYLWATLPIGHMDLGGIGTSGQDGSVDPIFRYAAVSGNYLTQPVEMSRPLTLRGAVAGLRLFARGSLFNNGASWEIFNDTNDLKFLFAGATGVIFGTSSDTGIHPSFDDAKCGRTSFRWQIMGTTIRAATYTVATLPSAATRGAGAQAFVSDSNATLAAGHGNTVAAGGANFVPVYSDGTNWRIG